ncbi:MAG TPA: DUF6527 family protein [Allosphingosinicella sp.]|jgi:hypothetical protein
MQHEFVNTIPHELQDGVLYISTTYATAVHRCACGCGHEVVTPLSPTDWSMVFDGETISLAPSIGNWSFPCQSHYWIERNRIAWAPKWSRRQVEDGRSRDRRRKSARFDVIETKAAEGLSHGRWRKLFKWFVS